MRPARKKPAKRSVPPPADTHDPGFSFRWKAYDGSAAGKFCKFPLSLIFAETDGGFIERPGIWADIPLASKSVLPVLMHFGNSTGRCWPSQEVICAMSGINSRKTARRGVRVLEDAGLVSTKKVTKTDGRPLTVYELHIPDDEHYVPLHASLFVGGIWSVMADHPTAHALYPVLRAFAKPRPDLDLDGEWIAVDSDEWRTWYSVREYDWCRAEKSELIRFAGISSRSYSTAMDFMRSDTMKILDRTDDAPEYWRVRFMDRWSFKPEFLNSRLKVS